MSVKPYRRFDEAGNKHTYGPEYLRVSCMDCCVCGKRGWWAHHVKSVGSGGVDIMNLAPLCQTHHMEIEKGGNKWFQEKYQIDLTEIAMKIGFRSPNL